MSALDNYYEKSLEQLRKVHDTQWEKIQQAGAWLADTLVNDRWLYAFGTGHSHLLAAELFYRAGGLARAVPMLDEDLMLHKNAIEATYLERREGYAAQLMSQYPMERGDMIIVASNSGRNAVPTELALLARERGLKTVAITNRAHSDAWPARHSSGKKLADAAELVIDNCGINGDATIELPALAGKIGPTSTITGALIINAIVIHGIELALTRNHQPEIYISSNSNGDDHNDRMLQKYKSRIRHL